MTDDKAVQTAKALLAFDDDESKHIAQGIVTDIKTEMNPYEVSYKDTTFINTGRATVTLQIQLDYHKGFENFIGKKVLVVTK